MSQPASFDQPRPGETILACRHNAKSGREQFFVGHTDQHGNPTGLGIWVKSKDVPDGIYARWVSLCAKCADGMSNTNKNALTFAARMVVWQRRPDEQECPKTP